MLRELPGIVIENIEHYCKEHLIKIMSTQRETAKNLFALLENLLTWSRIQREMIEYRPQHMNIEKVIVRNMALLMPSAQQKQITFKNLIQEEISLYADVNMVDTVIRNLISNALKFTHSGGTVEILAQQDDHKIEVSVSDTGIGIEEEHLPKLFRIDARYKRAGTDQEEGTGLGLILCKEFIERHRGKIWVESQVGKGTAFTFTLPLAAV